MSRSSCEDLPDRYGTPKLPEKRELLLTNTELLLTPLTGYHLGSASSTESAGCVLCVPGENTPLLGGDTTLWGV